jgi:hypothetical protein
MSLAASFLVTLGWAGAPDVKTALAEESSPAVPPAPPSSEAVAPATSAGTPLPWPKGGPPRLVWTGFQMTDGASKVVLQTSAEVLLDARPTKSGISVRLRGCRILTRSIARPLDTRFFPTPVKLVSVEQRGRNIEVEIALKEPVAATPRKEVGPNGTHFWVLDFPPASVKGTPVEAPAKPSAPALSDISAER